MDPCNRGEMLTKSVQENAANRPAATRTRAEGCERPQMFIDSELVTMAGSAQAIFWGDDMAFNEAKSVNKRRIDGGAGKSIQQAAV
jgi:hypothetical protein